MTTYAAFLRGIMPMNPNMRGEKLRGAFEAMGFGNVRSVIASGNIIFESDSADVPALEQTIEEGLKKKLGISSPAYVRSQKEIEGIVRKDPFKGAIHGRSTYLIVSFLKKPPRQIYSSLDITKTHGAEFMRGIEKQHGKDVTTRTWKTVEKVAAKMKP